jgi:hypothetical protein
VKKFAVIAVFLTVLVHGGTAAAQEPTATPPPIATVTDTGLTARNNPDIPFFSAGVQLAHESLNDENVAIETIYVAGWTLVSALVTVLAALKFRDVFVVALVITAMFGLGTMLQVVDWWMPVVLGISAFSLAAMAKRVLD